MTESAPYALWSQAKKEHPDDDAARRSRYIDLMRQHGDIIDREPGDHSPLFSCGYCGDPTDGTERYCNQCLTTDLRDFPPHNRLYSDSGE